MSNKPPQCSISDISLDMACRSTVWRWSKRKARKRRDRLKNTMRIGQTAISTSRYMKVLHMQRQAPLCLSLANATIDVICWQTAITILYPVTRHLTATTLIQFQDIRRQPTKILKVWARGSTWDPLWLSESYCWLFRWKSGRKEILHDFIKQPLAARWWPKLPLPRFALSGFLSWECYRI